MRLARRVWGTGGARTAALIHGAAGSSASWHRFAPWLAGRRWEVHAVDLRGHGSSATWRAVGGGDLEELADDVLETLGEVGRAPVDLLLGHSLGALVALECVRTRPEIASSVVLVDPPGPRTLDFEVTAEECAAAIAAARNWPAAAIDELRRAHPALTAEWATEIVAGTAAADASAVTDTLRRLAGIDLRQVAAGSETPALVLFGRLPPGPVREAEMLHYSACGSEDRAALRASLAQVTMVEFATGHHPHYDAGRDFQNAVADWLDRDGACGGRRGRLPS